MENPVIDKILKEVFNTTKEKIIEKYVPLLIKEGSKVLLENKNFEIVGVRNSRDRKIFINLVGDFNSTDNSCNYSHTRLYIGKF